MSSKRRWDQQGPIEDDSSKVKPEDKSATDAAAAAAAIAAKIAAQFAGGALAGMKDPHDGDFVQDIDINDVRNRYMLTKGSTQQQVTCVLRNRTFVFLPTFVFSYQIHEETGASVSTKGVWYPDRSKATEKDPPLYLHIAATTPEILQEAIDKVNELIAIDLGSLVEDKKDRLREKVSIHYFQLACLILTFFFTSVNGQKKNYPLVWKAFVILTSVPKWWDQVYVLFSLAHRILTLEDRDHL